MELLSELNAFKSLTGEVSSAVRRDGSFYVLGLRDIGMSGRMVFLANTRAYLKLLYAR
jgi:hypothetical protein